MYDNYIYVMSKGIVPDEKTLTLKLLTLFLITNPHSKVVSCQLLHFCNVEYLQPYPVFLQFFFSNHFHSCLNTMNTFPKRFTQWTLQTHTSAYQLTFGAKCTTTTKTLHTSPKSESCRNFSKCSLSEYNDLKNTKHLKHCQLHI